MQYKVQSIGQEKIPAEGEGSSGAVQGECLLPGGIQAAIGRKYDTPENYTTTYRLKTSRS